MGANRQGIVSAHGGTIAVDESAGAWVRVFVYATGGPERGQR